jgi:hypothetical protein
MRRMQQGTAPVRRAIAAPLRAGAVIAAVAAAAAAGCRGPEVDIREQLQVTEVTTGWYDAGLLPDGKNKLVPTISLQLRNAGSVPLTSVQLNAVFRRVGEEESWGEAFVARAIGTDGLGPGASTPPIVLQSQLGYTGEQPRAQMLLHSEFQDARVELFAKRGSETWTKVGEYEIKRQLLTR